MPSTYLQYEAFVSKHPSHNWRQNLNSLFHILKIEVEIKRSLQRGGGTSAPVHIAFVWKEDPVVCRADKTQVGYCIFRFQFFSRELPSYDLPAFDEHLRYVSAFTDDVNTKHLRKTNLQPTLHGSYKDQLQRTTFFMNDRPCPVSSGPN